MAATHKDIIIIGAGIAGLACAARLAAKGHRVTVFEKNSYAGGKLGLLQQDGYTFDTGPSLFTQPYVLEALFKDCGAQLNEYLTYTKPAITTQYFYADGTLLTAYADADKLKQELQTVLGIEIATFNAFLRDAEKLYQNIGTIFLDEPIHKLRTWFSPKILKAFAALKPAYLLKSMHTHHRQILQHDKLVQLFDRFATYNGSNPFEAPAMLSMIAHLELNEGVYYPIGGMRAIGEAVYTLCKKLGVQFHFHTAVTEITTQQHVVTGIVANGAPYKANVVISNSDVYFTYQKLLSDAQMANKLQRQERSSSAIIFYWGMQKQFPQLDLHNIFFTTDYRAEFQSIFKDKQPYHDPTVYVNITAKQDSTHAPDGCENWFVLVNTPAGNETSDAIAFTKAHVIDKLSKLLDTNIERYIATEKTLTPSLIEKQTGSYMGALYGTASNNRMAAFMRHSNTSGKYKGLYFAGGTVHPGGGIPLCLRSAKLVADAID
ncbi:MAG TPA: 1-hydroxycarotenoid 3,4-desaturase CrtD [Flavipsychrobacter sp.]